MITPGKWIKDGSNRSYVEITKVDGDIAYGKSYLCSTKRDYTTDLPEITWEPLDETNKIWFISMHEWEPFYKS